MAIAECTSWECINSFGNWLSAIGTILISGVALWLSVKDRMILMKASFDVGLIPGDNPAVLDREVFILNFTNVGSRPITVTNHCWKFPFFKGIVFLMPNMDHETGHFCTKLPCEITDGKDGYAFYRKNFFSELENSEDLIFHKSLLVAWLRINFFKMYICTSIGKRINVRVNGRVRKKLWALYKATRNKI